MTVTVFILSLLAAMAIGMPIAERRCWRAVLR